MPLASLSVIDRGGQNPKVLISFGLICRTDLQVDTVVCSHDDKQSEILITVKLLGHHEKAYGTDILPVDAEVVAC